MYTRNPLTVAQRPILSESTRYTVRVKPSLRVNSCNQKVNSEQLKSHESASSGHCPVPEPGHNEAESVCLFNLAFELREVDRVAFGKC